MVGQLFTTLLERTPGPVCWQRCGLYIPYMWVTKPNAACAFDHSTGSTRLHCCTHYMAAKASRSMRWQWAHLTPNSDSMHAVPMAPIRLGHSSHAAVQMIKHAPSTNCRSKPFSRSAAICARDSVCLCVSGAHRLTRSINSVWHRGPPKYLHCPSSLTESVSECLAPRVSSCTC